MDENKVTPINKGVVIDPELPRISERLTLEEKCEIRQLLWVIYTMCDSGLHASEPPEQHLINFLSRLLTGEDSVIKKDTENE